jgi:hypothetical protein
VSQESLSIYLQDHLAGAAVAVEILEALRDEHSGEVGDLARALLVEVEEDRATLEALAERAGPGSSVLKETTAWLGAKLARFKLGRAVAADLGTLEALETLALGILGKCALWDALKMVDSVKRHLDDVELDVLAGRARDQHARVEAQRLIAARQALG